MSLPEALAVIAAVAAAASFGGAGLLQHHASRQAPPRGPLRPGLLLDLMRIRAFRWGVVLGVLGFALQATALRFGPLGLVQPILVTGVLFYLGFAALSMHRVPDLRLLGAALLTVVGITGFLLSASPNEGNESTRSGSALLVIVLLAVLVACLVAARLIHRYRVIPLAVAAAICYGSTAALVRSLLAAPDLHSPFGQWELYAIVVLGPAGFLLNQNAFQAGPFGSVAVAIITVGDPVVAIVIGAFWLNESIASGPLRLVADVLSLLVTAAGIVLLNRRAEAVAREVRGETGEEPEVA